MSKKIKDELGNRMKSYEAITSQKMIDGLPVIIRLDGRSFSTYTSKFKKPYDERLWYVFDETTKFLAQETNAVISYTQSDEITLILFKKNTDSQLFFDGKINKINSVVASLCTAKFNDLAKQHLPEVKKYATFDCRTFNVPSKEEAVNCLIWRELDNFRNAIAGAAQATFSHKSLQGLDSKQLQEKLFQEAGINFNDYPVRFKRGGYFKRITESRKFSIEELEKLPLKHAARLNPELEVVRSSVKEYQFENALHKVENRVELIFD